MKDFILRPRHEQLDIIKQTAAKLDMDPAAVEKDFWVCWVLRCLFQSSLRDKIIFKGGTSLSKVYGLIRRFSEDIDLILNWEAFSVTGDWNPGEHYGKSGKEKMLKSLDEWSTRCIAQAILPVVQQSCGEWCCAEVSPSSPEVIVLTYPRQYESSYICPRILLEIGPKAAWNPHAEHVVRPYMAEVYPQLFRDADATVQVTTAERAFWEKVTILHAQAHRPTALPPRYARHYYDTVMMARHEDLKKRAFDDIRLLYQVSSFKYYFYRAGWADYPNAVPGQMHLMPGPAIRDDLEQDYQAMRREMLPADAPELGILLQEIADLEREINTLTPLPLEIRNYPSMAPLP